MAGGILQVGGELAEHLQEHRADVRPHVRFAAQPLHEAQETRHRVQWQPATFKAMKVATE